MQKINAENWTSAHFHLGHLKAFISLGAAPLEFHGQVEIQYLVTLTDKDYQEIYQSTHPNLDAAIQLLNEKYGEWELWDALSKNTHEGCESCAAH